MASTTELLGDQVELRFVGTDETLAVRACALRLCSQVLDDALAQV